MISARAASVTDDPTTDKLFGNLVPYLQSAASRWRLHAVVDRGPKNLTGRVDLLQVQSPPPELCQWARANVPDRSWVPVLPRGSPALWVAKEVADQVSNDWPETAIFDGPRPPPGFLSLRTKPRSQPAGMLPSRPSTV